MVMVTSMVSRHSDLSEIITLIFVAKTVKTAHNVGKSHRHEIRVLPLLQKRYTSSVFRTSNTSKKATCDSPFIHRCMWWLPSLFQLHRGEA